MKLFLPILLSIILFGVAESSYAQTGGEDRGTIQDHLMMMREKRLDIREKIEEKRQEFSAKREDLRENIATRQAQNRQRAVERIKTVFGKILVRADAALVRLDKIADKIASRIDKLKAKGVNTSSAEAKLAQAEAMGAAAANAINDAKLKVEAIDSSSSSVRDAVHAASQAVRDAKKALFDYHKALVAVLRELKASIDLREGTNGAK